MDSAQWDDRYSQDDLVWGINPNQFVAAQIEAAGLAPGRALDLACGEGRNSIWLASLGWQVKGIDFSGVAIDKARTISAERNFELEFEVADVLSCELAKDSYDLVLLAYVQLGQSERALLVERSIEALAPSGVLLVVAHDSTNLTKGYGGPQSDELLWSVHEAREQLEAMTVEIAEVVERTVDTEEGPRVALDTLIRARKH